MEESDMIKRLSIQCNIASVYEVWMSVIFPMDNYPSEKIIKVQMVLE